MTHFQGHRSGGGGGGAETICSTGMLGYFYFFMWASNFGVGGSGHMGIQKQHNVEN